MDQFNVPKMSCGSCLNNITKAIHKLDANAKVEADFPTKALKIVSTVAEIEIIKAMVDAGYSPIK